MAGERLKWMYTAEVGSNAIVEQGSKVAVYAFCLVNGTVGAQTATFRTGGASGRVISYCVTGASAIDIDSLDGNGGFIEAEDGVFAEIGGSGDNTAACILVGFGTLSGA